MKIQFVVAATLAALALPAHADRPEHLEGLDAVGRHDERPAPMRTATGQLITPTAVRGSTQQLLNPRLPAYPSFVAAQALRSQLSPDGTTLAILCAGQNSLYKPDGSLDTPNSTQYVFLFDVSGKNRSAP